MLTDTLQSGSFFKSLSTSNLTISIYIVVYNELLSKLYFRTICEINLVGTATIGIPPALRG